MILSFDLVFAISAFWLLVLGIVVLYYRHRRNQKEEKMIEAYEDELEIMRTVRISTVDEQVAINTKLNDSLQDIAEQIEQMNDHLDSFSITNTIKQFVMSDGFEVDTVYDHITERETVCEPYKADNPQLPREFMIDITLDEDITYTVAVPKSVFNEIKRMLRAKVEHQGGSTSPTSMRKFYSDLVDRHTRIHAAPVSVQRAVDNVTSPDAGMALINPALEEAMRKLQQGQ